jgi:hypothetical protein
MNQDDISSLKSTRLEALELLNEHEQQLVVSGRDDVRNVAAVEEDIDDLVAAGLERIDDGIDCRLEADIRAAHASSIPLSRLT